MLVLGPARVAIVGRATAFPARTVATPELLAALTPELEGPAGARRAALAAHLEAEVGVRTRAFVTPPERALDLAIAAARDALGAAGIEPGAIVAHVHATSTPSRWTGPEAARIGQALGLGAAFFDVRSGCTGGLWALVQGARLAADARGPVLVTAADAFSLTFPARGGGERLLPLTMGDGAAAIVLTPTDTDAGIVRAVFAGSPEHADLATVPAELPPRPNDRFELDGDPAAFGQAAEHALTAALAAVCAPTDARVVVVTGRAAVARRVAAEPWLGTLSAHGHVGAAHALVALCELPRGHHPIAPVAIVSAGGGISSGAVLWREHT